jgi:hypothetical protein
MDGLLNLWIGLLRYHGSLIYVFCIMWGDFIRYFQVDSTLGIHPIRLLVFRPLHQQNFTRLNVGSFMLSPNHACSGLLGLARACS